MQSTKQQREYAHADRPSRNMGIGKLGQGNMVFVRKFRFSLEGTYLSDWSIKAVSLNLLQKQLVIKGYEVIQMDGKTGQDAPIEIWAQGLSEGRWPNEVLRLTTYDGCGKGLYEYTFEGLKVVNRRLDFNMATSEESCQRVLVSFQSYSRKLLINQADHKWRFLLDGADREIEVELDGRPNINIAETPIDFMNGKTWIPGKTKWQNLTMIVSLEDVSSLLKLINSGVQEQYVGGKLKLYDRENSLKETWTLGGLWAKGFDRQKDHATIRLTFDQVAYDAVYSQKA